MELSVSMESGSTLMEVRLKVTVQLKESILSSEPEIWLEMLTFSVEILKYRVLLVRIAVKYPTSEESIKHYVLT